MRLRSLVLAAALASLPSIGCRSSFELGPSEVPSLRNRTVNTRAGAVEEVPEEWTAKVVPRDGDDLWRLMAPKGGDRVRAFPIPEPEVERAEDTGWTDDPVEFKSPFDGGLVAAPPGPTDPQGRPVQMLWVRDARGRIVELPVDYVERVEVEGARPPGQIVGIVAGSAAGAAVLVTLMFLLLSNAPYAH